MIATRILFVSAVLGAALACNLDPKQVILDNGDTGFDVTTDTDVAADTDGGVNSGGNNPPHASAGPDQTQNVFPGALVYLDGSSSSDIDGDSLDYAWTVLSRPPGSVSSLVNADFPNSNLYVDKSGEYLVQLDVSDGSLHATDTVRIVVTQDNEPPHADAGFDQSVTLGALVQLSGAASSDPDSDPLEYHWEFLSKPPSSAAQLSGASLPAAAVSPTFVADQPGLYTIRLIVNDGLLDSQPDIVSISSTDPGSGASGGGGSSSSDCLSCAAEAGGITSNAWTTGDVAGGFGLLGLPVLLVAFRKRKNA